MANDPDYPEPSRRLFRALLGLRVLMVVVLVLGLVLGWIVHRARVQREVVAAVRRAGGRVQYDYEWKDLRSIPNGQPRWPRWLVERLGVDYFADVTGVGFHGTGADEVASQVARLGRVEAVVFNGSDLTDEGLARLEGSGLRMVYLAAAKEITDAGLIHLGRMPRLERVDLFDASIGDAGLEHLGRVRHLRWLHLGQTKVTDAGMEHVGRMRGLATLHLFGTKVGDLGAARLKALGRLKTLSLDRTAVSDPGRQGLRSALPGATISP